MKKGERPDKLKASKSLSQFKNAIKSWKPVNCPCELCKVYLPGVGYANVTNWFKIVHDFQWWFLLVLGYPRGHDVLYNPFHLFSMCFNDRIWTIMLLKLLLSDVEYILFVWILTQLVDFYMELKFYFEYLYFIQNLRSRYGHFGLALLVTLLYVLRKT